MKLLIAIPTWNRAEYLDKAIHAISVARAHAPGCQVELFISDNCSTDPTQEVVTRWQKAEPWIHYRRWATHAPMWRDILNRVLKGSDLEFDYLWLHGDDDWISDPTAFAQLGEALEASHSDPPAIVHCCQTRRALIGDTRLIAGNTEDLCNTYGWHDLLGWMSSLVMPRDTVDRMMASPQWDSKTPSAFSHSEALLEAGYGRTMLLITAGLIDPQDEAQTPECEERWVQGGGAAAYWFIPHGLLSLKQRGILTTPLALGFFRYHTYSIWDRFAVNLMSLASDSTTSSEELETKLRALRFFGDLLGYGEDRKLYESWCDAFQDDVRDVHRIIRVIHRRMVQSDRPSYAFSLLPPPSPSGVGIP
ncbi:MAG: hypothetical protein A3J24_04670 [Deltaproteobacteria bacterium RIFCSPLOWO2_02_FULL_53_8]|nr:MAG: hypothetical protein A3J24_04670 [Deltaproteobacteria bacterium RIFCSPLOWO2_02_FULL_53_8]